MSIGELWVANPIFPWVMILLALWISTSTAAQVRNWFRIRRLEQSNRLLQELIMGGVHGLSGRINEIKKEYCGRSSKSRSRHRKKRNQPKSVNSTRHRIPTEEPEPAAIEEIGENSDSEDNVLLSTSKSSN